MAHFSIEDWMVSDMGLSGQALLVFALIHSCTQEGDGCWYGGYDRLAERIGGKKRGAIDAVNNLIVKEYITKTDSVIFGKQRTILVSNITNKMIMSWHSAENAQKDVNSAKNALDIVQKMHSPITNSINNNITTSNKKIIDKDNLVFPFSSDKFHDVWSTLISQPKWKKKPGSALQLSLNKLKKYQEPFAIMLMEDAIERGWQGVVFENTDSRYETWLKTTQNIDNKDSAPASAVEATKEEASWKQDHYLYGLKDFMENDPYEFELLNPFMQEDLKSGKKILRKDGVWEFPEYYPNYEIFNQI